MSVLFVSLCKFSENVFSCFYQVQQTGKIFVLFALDPVNKIGFKSLSLTQTLSLCVCVCLNGHGGLFEVSNVVRLMYEQTGGYMHRDAWTDSDWSNNRCVL